MTPSRLPALALASLVISAPAILLSACQRSADDTQGVAQNTGILGENPESASDQSVGLTPGGNPTASMQNTGSMSQDSYSSGQQTVAVAGNPGGSDQNADMLSRGSGAPGKTPASVASSNGDPRGTSQDTTALSQGPGAPGKGTGPVSASGGDPRGTSQDTTGLSEGPGAPGKDTGSVSASGGDPRGTTQDTAGLSQGPGNTGTGSMNPDARSIGTSAKDAAITALVKSKLLADPDVSGTKINVDTRDKVVTLTGTVATPMQMARAASLAAQADGVSSVNNRLLVAAR